MTLDDLERPVSKCMLSEPAVPATKKNEGRRTISDENVGE